MAHPSSSRAKQSFEDGPFPKQEFGNESKGGGPASLKGGTLHAQEGYPA